MIAGQAELDLGPESVSPSPVLLQRLGRTPKDTPTHTSGPLRDTPRRSYSGKGISWCHKSSYPPHEGFPLSCPAQTLPGAPTPTDSSTSCMDTSPWAQGGQGCPSSLFPAPMLQVPMGQYPAARVGGSMVKELESRRDYWGAGGQIPTHGPWLPSPGHEGFPL